MFQTTAAKTKNVVLSGEAMKEMQKQAKANKDERRMHVSHISPGDITVTMLGLQLRMIE